MEAVYPGAASYGARFTNRPSPLLEGLAYQHRSGVHGPSSWVPGPPPGLDLWRKSVARRR